MTSRGISRQVKSMKLLKLTFLTLLVHAGAANAIVPKCTDGSFGLGHMKLCRHFMGSDNSSCPDRSDVKYCSKDGLFTGCLAHEYDEVFRIVPCHECKCQRTARLIDSYKGGKRPYTLRKFRMPCHILNQGADTNKIK